MTSVDNPVENSVLGVDYLDTYAKVSNDLENNELEQKKLRPLVAKFLYHFGHIKEADRLTYCGQNWVCFKDTAGHELYSQRNCGLPYCPTCGKPGSALNKRRANRVKNVLLGFPALGHFVFTLPKEISGQMPGSQEIDQLYRLAWKILKDWLNAEAAIIVLHFCGDKKNGLHLHFDASFPILHRNGECQYPIGLLNQARAEWTAGINQVFKTRYLDTVGHYNFVNTIEQQHHLIKYITRSTVPAEKFIELTDAQKEYCVKMNKRIVLRYFGEFVGKKKIEFLAKYRQPVERNPGDLIDQRICPICREKMSIVKDGDRRPKTFYSDDIPLKNVVRYNHYTFIDKAISIYLRDDKGLYRPPSLEETIEQQEIERLIDEVLDQKPEEIFKESEACL